MAIFLDTSPDKKNSIHYNSVNTTCTLYKFPWRFYINISLGSDISGLCLLFNHATFFFLQILLNKAKCDDSERFIRQLILLVTNDERERVTVVSLIFCEFNEKKKMVSRMRKLMAYDHINTSWPMTISKQNTNCASMNI